MTPLDPAAGPPPPLARRLRGRLLGGVCAGIAASRGLSVAPLRAAFAAAALLGGLGVLVYLACWLIIPAEGEDGRPQAARGIVVIAQACAALAGLATLVALAAAATIFGFGWAVVAIAAVALAAALAAWPRVGPAGALLPVAALASPSVVLAAAAVHIEPRVGAERVTPASARDLPGNGYTSGLGQLLVDLRDTALPATGVVPLTIHAGIRRTIVALPHDRCVRVSLRWHVRPFAAQLANFVVRGAQGAYPDVMRFGEARFERRSDVPVMTSGTRPGPRLALRFESAGGSLVVRDYPDGVDPRLEPEWPGYLGDPEPRPDTTGVRPRAAREMLRSWRVRRREQVADQRRIESLMPGPCAAQQAKGEPAKRAKPRSGGKGRRR